LLNEQVQYRAIARRSSEHLARPGCRRVVSVIFLSRAGVRPALDGVRLLRAEASAVANLQWQTR
jgi:hypothetical protein